MPGPRRVNPGDSFGLVVVLGDAEPTPQDRGRGRAPKYRRVVVRCFCGSVVAARVRDLLRGETVSCGCYKRSFLKT